MKFVPGLLILAAAAGLPAAENLPPLEAQRLARSIFQELIEVNTTDSAGSTTAAAKGLLFKPRTQSSARCRSNDGRLLKQNSPSLSNSSRTVATSAAFASSGFPKATVTGYRIRFGNFVKNFPPW